MIKVFNSIEEAKKTVGEGNIKLFIINGKKIALAHTVNGLKAFDNACPHQKEPLNKGTITSFGEIVCALHHFRFDLRTGHEANSRCPAMKIYPVLIMDSGVYLDL